MEESVKKLTTKEIATRISELEDTYANSFQDHLDVQDLSKIWKKIQELQKELNERDSQRQKQ